MKLAGLATVVCTAAGVICALRGDTFEACFCFLMAVFNLCRAFDA